MFYHEHLLRPLKQRKKKGERERGLEKYRDKKYRERKNPREMGVVSAKKDEMKKEKQIVINYKYLEKRDMVCWSKIKALYPSLYHAHVQNVELISCDYWQHSNDFSI